MEGRKENVPPEHLQFCQFDQPSPLQFYLGLYDSKYFRRNVFGMQEVLDDIKAVIDKEKFYDQNNTGCIIGSRPFAAALGVQVLHHTQLKDFVCKQLKPLTRVANTRLLIPYRQLRDLLDNSPYSPVIFLQRTKSMGLSCPMKPHTKVVVNPRLLQLLSTVDGFPSHHSYHFFGSVVRALGQFILNHRMVLVPQENPHMCYCENHPLGSALGGFRAFHRLQIKSILRHSLTLYKGPAPEPFHMTLRNRA